MRPRPRRSSNAARPSSASGGCAIALSPTASRKPATACSPSHGCRQVSGEAREQRTRSSVCTKSSSGGSRRRLCCRRQKRQRCCSGRCSPLVRSTCARLMVGRRSPQSPSINRLTSPPDQILSKCRRSRHQIPTPLATAPLKGPEHEGYTLYSSHAVWQSRAKFEAWTKSEAFRLAHRDAGQNKPLYLDHPQFEGFEVRQTVRRGEDAVA